MNRLSRGRSVVTGVNRVQPVITPSDRFGLTLCFAIIVHAVVILGVNFSLTVKDRQRFQSMEIILVQQRSEQPDKPNYLAQANLEGGGNAEDPARPAAPLAAPFVGASPEIVASASTQKRPAPPQRPATQKPAAEDVSEHDRPAKEAATPPQPPQPKPIVAHAQEPSQPEPLPPSPGSEDSAPAPGSPPDPPAPTATALISQSFAVASLSAEIDQKLEARAKRPRRKFISANTREYKYASYMEAWRAKVERIGNLNYPDEARGQKLSGDLILDVALNPDGSVNEIMIRRPSSYKVLNDAAIRIVRLAAPFAPFPEEIKKEVDILHITRTWQFLDGDRFLSKGGGGVR
jgi:periplasmic protein TonB